MKKLVIVLMMFLFSVVSAQAQTDSGMKGEQKGEMKQPGMKMDEGMMKQMMEKCRLMMKQMMGDEMMKQMMPMMMEMMNMQEKMQKMMSMHMGMMGMDDPQSKLKCTEQWLKKAIDLHELHMKDPKTMTEASQVELMDQMKKAYDCITKTGTEKSEASKEEPSAKETKKDAHEH